MTYDELVQALRCCSFGCDCEKCPARRDESCVDHVFVLAAEAMDRLLLDNATLRADASIAKALQALLEQLRNQRDRMLYENASLRAQPPRWRSVREELPPVGRRVLATACNRVYIAARSKVEDSWVLHGLWGVTNASGNGVTHWMPMPDLPKEG